LRRFIETAYVVLSVAPLVWLGLVAAQTEGSLVSGIAIGAVIPLVALVSLLFVLAGLALLYAAHRQRRTMWHLVIGTAASSPVVILVVLAWLFG
jgi:hypothetical protein